MKIARLSRPLVPILFVALLLLSCPKALGLPADKLVDGNPNTVQNEIDLTLIPGQQGRLAMAYNDDPNGGTPLGIGYSSDFGVSWNTTQLSMPSAPPTVQPPWSPNPMTTMFDPTITADANGNVFAAGIAAGANSGFSSLFGGGPDSGFYAYKSTDFGQTWGAPMQISYDQATQSNYEDPNYRFNDRCRIRADVYSGSSLYANNVYPRRLPSASFAVSQSRAAGCIRTSPLRYDRVR